jgi:TIR domain/SIR2-like domain
MSDEREGSGVTGSGVPQPVLGREPSDRPRAFLNEREWEKLTSMVSEGRVVPVVGPDLLMVRTESGHEESLYDRWGRALAEQADIPVPVSCSIPLLYYVTNRRSLDQAANDLAWDIDDVVRKQEAPIPEALRKLAEITSLPVYLTTTIDHQLKRALDVARSPGGTGARQIMFSPRGAKAQVDLPADLSADVPCVFHLFGATSPVDEAFAKTEDDLIEFSWSLLDNQYAPEALYEYLRKKTVLLLGCQFPDWLGRFLIYALHGRRPEALNVYYVGSELEQGLEDFLKRRKAKVLQVPRTVDFVDELHRRWASNKPRPAPTHATTTVTPALEMKGGAVFLSYAREDLAVVSRIRAELEAANVDTWMDMTGLEPGVEYQQIIHDNIRSAAFFVPIISRSLNADRLARFLWKEWRWAVDANQERRQQDWFLQPLCIDDTEAGARFVESPMRDLNWTRLRNGRLPEELIRVLVQGIRRFRSPR